MPTIRFLIFQPGPLDAGRGFRISIDWLPCTCEVTRGERRLYTQNTAVRTYAAVWVELREAGRTLATRHELAEVDDILVRA